ncbi:MAG: hypothetical protein HC893_05025, partial [Chloroflexaceae bacterium]|nr:hypothetical protein [Chloroflexaceae bacterium]
WLYISAYWFFDRYLHPLTLFITIALVVLLPAPALLLPRMQRVYTGSLAVMLALQCGLSVWLLVAQPAPNGYLTIARWVNATWAAPPWARSRWGRLATGPMMLSLSIWMG